MKRYDSNSYNSWQMKGTQMFINWWVNKQKIKYNEYYHVGENSEMPLHAWHELRENYGKEKILETQKLKCFMILF